MKYIVKGGEFNNKGAEAMSLIAIYNIRKYDKNAQIYFIDYGYNTTIEKNVNVKYFTVDVEQLKLLAGKNRFKSILKKTLKFLLKREYRFYKSAYSEMKSIIRDADFFIDISGYSLSSVWGDVEVDFFLSWLEAISAQNPRCKMFLMPQSFGPFDSTFDKKRAIEALSKCEKIYAREKKGMDTLLEMGLMNVEYCYDSVLIENGYQPEEIVKNIEFYKENLVDVFPDSVGIIPNARLLDAGKNDEQQLLQLYDQIINDVLPKHYVYLIPHAGEDLALCKKIKLNYSDNERVVLIDAVPNSFVYEEMIKNINFVIASRYHSIIHAYRKSVPAIIIGWSDKYDEVARSFNQSEYLMDVKNVSSILNALDTMEKQWQAESESIEKKLGEIREHYKCYAFLGDYQ